VFDRSAPLQLGFFLQLRFVLDAIRAGQSAEELAALPVVEKAAETYGRCRLMESLPGDAGFFDERHPFVDLAIDQLPQGFR
jgi:hypothetical protein